MIELLTHLTLVHTFIIIFYSSYQNIRQTKKEKYILLSNNHEEYINNFIISINHIIKSIEGVQSLINIGKDSLDLIPFFSTITQLLDEKDLVDEIKLKTIYPSISKLLKFDNLFIRVLPEERKLKDLLKDPIFIELLQNDNNKDFETLQKWMEVE